MEASRPVIRLLGYAGLIPFVLPVLLVLAGWQHAALARGAAEIYAFGIVSFLCGSWWGLSLRDDSPRAFWLSNLFFLLAFFIYLVASAWWPLAAAIILISLLFAEQGQGLFSPFPPHYRKLRIQLSAVAAASMLLLQLYPAGG